MSIISFLRKIKGKMELPIIDDVKETIVTERHILINGHGRECHIDEIKEKLRNEGWEDNQSWYSCGQRFGDFSISMRRHISTQMVGKDEIKNIK